ncbi:alpha/beta fold hydrolase [Companilactobacillus ginsenosidimutans]|uniref:Alpha/beta hydrolase n=1 Tax=Companilactobacillus ginsenosidimutans TaxID=1007676 RepID=A0A0H4QGZ3_9LACO|nr:alpha/beta hydrolase [Companilactobacillus ginsenosidimutans]AKP67207.1 alpha/beta hydrolase [Companilactobacillus ginsenosidimutans]
MDNSHYITATNKKVTADNGITYVYREVGVKTGTPIVGLNHLSANLDNWDPTIIDGLAKDHWVITFDYRGVGSSTGKASNSIQAMAEDTINFIHALKLTKVDLLGFSMGGMIAQEVLLRDKDLVNRAILAGTGPKGGEGIENVTKLSDASLLRSLVTFKDIKTYLFFTRTENGKKSAADFIVRLYLRKDDRDKTINWFAYRTQLKAINKWGKENPADLSGIKTPILVVNGDNDIMVPTTPNTYQLKDRLSNSKLIIYTDAGHGAIAQYHESFVKSANEFYGEK